MGAPQEDQHSLMNTLISQTAKALIDPMVAHRAQKAESRPEDVTLLVPD